MSAQVVELRCPYDQIADASDRLAELIDTIPGWDCEHAAETHDELRRAAELLRQAIPLLERAVEREAGRCEEQA